MILGVYTQRLSGPALRLGHVFGSPDMNSTTSVVYFSVSKRFLSALQMYMSERPWAGLRPVQIILKKSQGKARLTWPEGTPAQYQALAERCMATDYKSRPTFAEVCTQIMGLPSRSLRSCQRSHLRWGRHAIKLARVGTIVWQDCLRQAYDAITLTTARLSAWLTSDTLTLHHPGGSGA